MNCAGIDSDGRVRARGRAWRGVPGSRWAAAGRWGGAEPGRRRAGVQPAWTGARLRPLQPAHGPARGDARPLTPRPRPQTSYPSPAALWAEVEAAGPGSWYGAAVAYWDAQEASDDGVLGGHSAVGPADVRESAAFLRKLLGPAACDAAAAGKTLLTAADCGAGVGRVSEGLLLKHCAVVDLVEPSAHLLKAARARLGSVAGGGGVVGKADRFLQCGLQDFVPEPGRRGWGRAGGARRGRAGCRRPRGSPPPPPPPARLSGDGGRPTPPPTPRVSRYDVIWVQWALLYLTDADAAAFLARCHAALRPGGVLVVKENVCKVGFVVDKVRREVAGWMAGERGCAARKTGGAGRGCAHGLAGARPGPRSGRGLGGAPAVVLGAAPAVDRRRPGSAQHPRTLQPHTPLHPPPRPPTPPTPHPPPPRPL